MTTFPAPATNLDDAYRACNPDRPLQANDPRYVDVAEIRGTHNFAKSITRSIRRSDEFQQLLFTGHRGSGKSTELFRLQAELESHQYLAIYLDVEEILDLVEINYLDVLLTIAKELEAQLRRKGFPLPDHLLESISDWFSEKIIETQRGDELKADLKTEAKAGVEIPFFAKLMSTFTAEIKTSSSRRETTRKKLEKELPIFINKLNVLISTSRQTIQNKGYKDLVLIIDGLEKMHYTVNSDGTSSHAELFVHHAEQLKAPQCHIIYTLPISLAYNANLGNDYDSIHVLPMIQTSQQGLDKLQQVIEKRVAIESVFETPELLTNYQN